MPRKPRIKDVAALTSNDILSALAQAQPAPGATPFQEDPVTTIMTILLPVHAAATMDWLVDATATAAETAVNAPFAFVYFEDESGTLTYKAPASDLRRRSVQRAIDAFGRAVSSKIDPATAIAIAEAVESDVPTFGDAGELLRGVGDETAMAAAQKSLGITTMSLTKLEAAGDRIGALLLMHVGTPESDHVRLLADHVACAAVNLRQATAVNEDEITSVVRTVFDARKTEVEFQRELMRAERYKREASICVIEATNLRLLRERFGPVLVEQLYDRVGQLLAQHSRDIDIIGQFKESGYTMILSEASPDAARQASSRLLNIALEAARDANVPGLELHLAVGWASYPVDGRATDAVFASAERRMYEAAA